MKTTVCFALALASLAVADEALVAQTSPDVTTVDSAVLGETEVDRAGRGQVALDRAGPGRTAPDQSESGQLPAGEPTVELPDRPGALIRPLPPTTSTISFVPAFPGIGTISKVESDTPAPVPGWSDWSTEKRIWVAGGIFVGLVLIGVISIG